MYYTQTELIKRKILMDKINIDTSRLTDLIKSDIQKKEKMIEGVKYYKCIHDILNHVHYYYVEFEKTIDIQKANNKVPHPFHRKLVKQKTKYICSKPINFTTPEVEIEDPENPTKEELAAIEQAQDYQTKLKDLLGDRFNKLMMTWITGASNKSYEVVHPYITPKNELKYIIVPAEECALIYDTQYQDQLKAVVRYYTYEFIAENGNKKNLYKVEYWTDKDVTYWEQIEDGSFITDTFYDVNPAGHFHTFNTSRPKEVKQHSWGKVPFIVLKNNDEMMTDLEPIKGLIDSYDKVKSGWINDIEDFQELIYVVKGYRGLSSKAQEGLSELAIFMQNVKTHKVIAVDSEGDVTTLKAEIPVDAKERFLKLTEKEIYKFADGVDMSQDVFGNNPSGVSIEFLYDDLHGKANETILYAKVALSELFWFLTKYINMKYYKNYNSTGMVFTFNLSRPTNQLETVQLLNQSDLSKQTYYENHPLIHDSEEEMKRKEREETEAREKGYIDLAEVDDDGRELPGEEEDSNSE